MVSFISGADVTLKNYLNNTVFEVAQRPEFKRLLIDYGHGAAECDTDTECVTVGGNVPNAQCVFPFVFNGETYCECAELANGQPWCSTQTDEFGTHVTGTFGFCAEQCPSRPMVTD